MANGYKTGGRKAGTPNKKKSAIKERLEELGCDPLEGMVKIAQDESVDEAIRVKVLIELCRYIYPKVRPVEIQPDRDERPEKIEIVIVKPTT